MPAQVIAKGADGQWVEVRPASGPEGPNGRRSEAAALAELRALAEEWDRRESLRAAPYGYVRGLVAYGARGYADDGRAFKWQPLLEAEKRRHEEAAAAGKVVVREVEVDAARWELARAVLTEQVRQLGLTFTPRVKWFRVEKLDDILEEIDILGERPDGQALAIDDDDRWGFYQHNLSTIWVRHRLDGAGIVAVVAHEAGHAAGRDESFCWPYGFEVAREWTGRVPAGL